MNIHENILVGRPYGGVSIMWNKSLSPYCNVILYEDNRLLGLSLTVNSLNYLFLNVYLPYFSNDNINDYDMYMGKIASIVENTDASGVVILGDFNARPSNPFYEELQVLCEAKDLIISDVVRLPERTFTHMNSGTLCNSWLDHCICSQYIHDKIVDIQIDENYYGSDHLPMYVSFNLECSHDSLGQSDIQEKIKWNFKDNNLSLIFLCSTLAEIAF